MHPALELFSVKVVWRNDHRLAISDRWHGAMPGAGWLTSKGIAAFIPVAAASLDAAVSFLVGCIGCSGWIANSILGLLLRALQTQVDKIAIPDEWFTLQPAPNLRRVSAQG